ncbi:hypothetical protein AKJ50_00475 [candidate division MSBL1 archaeon SCGC-AAA382A13]|uniref:Uncharacterized protein n=1 Tax=candidate division MSBL1 archaeon SCGC-AAA382A13 TaxID=1698279 RepID=A0A133VGP4_9EURY|nr:hypothetical protein AKJ50_00475 [candidate division MSBL1 archaeon SCGC-AAA382A13]
MKEILENFEKSVKHLRVLDEIFGEECSGKDQTFYKESINKIDALLNEYDKALQNELYNSEDRQMILSDLIEYIFTGRGYNFASQSKEHLHDFIEIILRFVNMLMCYDSLTSEVKARKKLLKSLREKNILFKSEDLSEYLEKSNGIAGVSTKDKYNIQKEEEISDSLLKRSNESKKEELWNKLNEYYDTPLPKTAGGLWHELTVYAFLLKKKAGHVLPLLLSQRLLHGGKNPIIPPDFILITEDKSLIGVEVGRKKEIQTGTFSLQTHIPTGTVDTDRSRLSDRCPICLKWLPMCPKVIEDFANPDKEIEKEEIKCIEECERYSEDEIAEGKCPYTKYSRKRAKTKDFTHHEYSDGYHYHYQCVLDQVDDDMAEKIKEGKDKTALKNHYPYYNGLEVILD